MRIGVNALYLIPGQVGGTEIYLRELMVALSFLQTHHDFVVFTNRETTDFPTNCVTLPVQAAFRPGRILYEQFSLPGVLRREQIDVLFNPGFTAPIRAHCPQVTVFHDLQHKRHPEYFRWFDLPFWQFFLWASVKKSQGLIAVSEATRDDLVRFYGVDPAKIAVVHHGVEPYFFDLSACREDGGYILCASTTHPHKNHERLLRCFARLREERRDVRLVLTGVRGFVDRNVQRLAESLGDAVELKGWVPRDQLYEIFRNARGFVYPSKFEGFGMPVLEALAAGIPTACSNIEPLKSISGGTAWLFDPEDDDSVLECLRLLAEGQARADGREWAARFTWERAATQTLRVIEDSLRA